MHTAIWTATGFLLGSIPFSYLIGVLFLRKDIRDFGDKAPGATNVAKAGGRALYIIAILLDAFKGTVPVLLAQIISGISGWEMILVAVSPVLGHAFTPFLKFQGGQGVATTFGVWLALTGWAGPLVLGACAGLMFLIQKNWVWSTIGGMIGLLVFLLAAHYPLQMAGAWTGHTAILFYKRRQLIRRWPEMQPWLARQVRKQ
jgi:glycerol-3-phosphate acyltransferase PlsY